MAGPYVHCLVSRESLKQLYADPAFKQYQKITNPDENAPFFPYVCLGSVSPDYPYAAQRIAGGDIAEKDENGWTWGDKFHKQNIGKFIKIGVDRLRSEDGTGIASLKKAAWLMGYYSHVITDLVIHAAIYRIVGGCYENHSADHLHCEIVQDSLAFHDIYSTPPKELIDEKFVARVLQKCQERPGPDWIPTQPPPEGLDAEIRNFWNSILSDNYGDFYSAEPPRINEWHYNYFSIMNDATGVIARWLVPGMAYMRSDHIPSNEIARCYTAIELLPDGTKKADYKNQVFKKAVDNVTRLLKDFLNALAAKDISAFQASLGDWNMDKGTHADKDPNFELWDGEITDLNDCKGDPPA